MRLSAESRYASFAEISNGIEASSPGLACRAGLIVRRSLGEGGSLAEADEERATLGENRE
jgi:hypothetical protein